MSEEAYQYQEWPFELWGKGEISPIHLSIDRTDAGHRKTFDKDEN